MKKTIILLSLAASSVFLAGCGYGSTTQPIVVPSPTTAVSPSPTADDVESLQKELPNIKLEDESFK